MKKVLILSDGRPGHFNQTIALANSLGLDYDIVRVQDRCRATKVISYLFDFLHITSGCLYRIEDIPGKADDYCFVAGTGSHTFYPLKVTAARMGVPARVIFYPKHYRTGSYERIYVPNHKIVPSKPNIERIDGAFVFASDSRKAQALQEFGERWAADTSNAVAFLIGGPCKHATLDADWLKVRLDAFFSELEEHNRLHPDSPEKAWVTSSRRTPAEVEKLLETYPWDYCLINSRDSYNPLLAFALLAKKVYITADSVSMVAEVLNAAKGEVCLLDNLNPGDNATRRFVDSLSGRVIL